MSRPWKARRQSVAELHTERRAWNARAISLAFGVLGLLTAVALLLTPAPAVTALIVGAVVTTALVNFLAWYVIRRGHVAAGGLLLVGSSLAQHVVVATDGTASTVTPYFASIFVLIGSSVLRLRWHTAVIGLGALALVLEWFAGRHAGLAVEELTGPYLAAAVLFSIMSVVSWLNVRSMERAFELATEHEHARQVLSLELDKSARMEALGRLAGGVAHDFNNLLVVVQGSAELASDDLPKDHPAQSELEQIQQAASRAADLTAQLLAFSKRQLVPPARIEPRAVLRGLEPLVKRLVGSHHHVTFEIEEGIDTVIASSTQLEQLVLNLAANARDAMRPGGHLGIHLAPRELHDGEVSDLPTGRYLELRVVDDGTGIPAEVMAHLFEPFFTTKEPGRGTGLGLATCFGIANQMGGTITVESHVGLGTTFHVFLPVATAEQARPSAPWQPTRNATLALVVDDDPKVRALVARVLGSAGLEVLEAHDGASSLARSRERPELDLIITDVVLGADNGMTVLEELRAEHPHARLVVMSSFSPDRRSLDTLTRHGAHFLAKPFTSAELLDLTKGPGTSRSRIATLPR